MLNLTNMVRTIIVDDDQLARKVLNRIISQNFEELEIIGEANSVEEGINLINETDPDLVFLDIEMPDGTGFDLIDQLPEVDFRLVSFLFCPNETADNLLSHILTRNFYWQYPSMSL